MSWREFVNLVLSTSSVEKLDEHWRPISLLCSPCIQWHQIIRWEKYTNTNKYRVKYKYKYTQIV